MNWDVDRRPGPGWLRLTHLDVPPPHPSEPPSASPASRSRRCPTVRRPSRDPPLNSRRDGTSTILGRTPPASRYSPDMSKHAYYGTDPLLKPENLDFADRL